jgi:hypothetical protein
MVREKREWIDIVQELVECLNDLAAPVVYQRGIIEGSLGDDEIRIVLERVKDIS